MWLAMHVACPECAGGHGVQSGHPSNGGQGGLGYGNFCRTALAILAKFAFPSAINTSFFQRKLHSFFFRAQGIIRFR